MNERPASRESQPAPANSAITEKLRNLWQEVFERPSIGLEEDFFKLGGDPARAVALFGLIRREFGRAIPPLAIYTAPTIGSLAAVIADGGPVRFPPAFLLKPGPAPPLFLLHGLGGNVMELFDVVTSIKSPNAIYGLQAKGSDGLETPLNSIEGMAAYHLEAIRKLQPGGPYLLCGYSLGGLIALEIARRLSEVGDIIALLSMIDSYPDASVLPAREQVRIYLQRARYRLSRTSPSPLPTEKICGAWATDLTKNGSEALRKYRPQRYPGTVRFIRAKSTTVFPRDPAIAWRDMIAQLEVETVTGDHHGMLCAHDGKLASMLSRHINDALATRPLASRADGH